MALARRLGVASRHICRDFAARFESPRTGSRNPELAADAVARITSYNVCYTKLLRGVLKGKLGTTMRTESARTLGGRLKIFRLPRRPMKCQFGDAEPRHERCTGA